MWAYNNNGRVVLKEATESFPAHLIGHALSNELYYLPDVHTQLRELLKKKVDNWIKDFDKKAKSTTNLKTLINRKLSHRGLAFKDDPNKDFKYKDYGISRYYMRGYDSAINGDNPFLDEIRAPDGTYTQIKMSGKGKDNILNIDLYYFINGYYDSVTDGHIFNFTKDEITPPLKAQNKNLIESSFKLLVSVFTTDCYTTLVSNDFINSSTGKKDFEKIFKGKEVINKIDWIGTMEELARFVFLLHNDYNEKENTAVCKSVKNLPLVASKCFYP